MQFKMALLYNKIHEGKNTSQLKTDEPVCGPL